MVLVLAEGLSDLGVLDHVEYGLCLLLQLLVRGDGLFTLLRKLWVRSGKEEDDGEGAHLAVLLRLDAAAGRD